MATRNYVPRANGEGSIGTEKKRWGAIFAEKVAVKALEVIGGGTENDAQPATVGWVKQQFQKLMSEVFRSTGITVSTGNNGYINFGELFGNVKIQWGKVTVSSVSTPPDDSSVRNVTLPIAFENSDYVIVAWDDNTKANMLRVYKSQKVDKNKFQVKVITIVNGSPQVTPDNFSMAYIAIGR